MKTTTKSTLKMASIILLLISMVLLHSCTLEMYENAKKIVEKQIEDANKLASDSLTYKIVGTNQTSFYNNATEMNAPQCGEAFFGQDASYAKNSPHYTDNGDGTITDNMTGLMWQQDPGKKLTYEEAVAGAAQCKTAGYNDWRLPGIKELYSLIIFSGKDPSGYNGTSTSGLVPFIDTNYFVFQYGKAEDGDRIIDSQYASASLYVGDSEFGGGNLMFGVNFADGRIKGYPTGAMPGQSQGKLFYVMYVRGNENYGKNNFVDHGDGTISDLATGLMWMKADNGKGVNWEDALDYAENLDFAGYSDWRLPNVKELQSIVDYSRSPSSSNSAAIDPVFECTSISNEGGEADHPYCWSSTTHANWNSQSGANAAYVSFGRALGYFNHEWMDVHGAGAQRSDPKVGDSNSYPYGHGPQGDAIRIDNYVRCVRTIQ
ncbi:MAG: DUF1566 domain-containing protein [Prolixibacteraceae bacterium]|nr:DUF1566 domain-containing protein [Prolixibacteraceae bacterium]